MQTQQPKTDPLDIAYLAMGAQQAITELRKEQPFGRLSQRHESEMDMMSEVIAAADVLAKLWLEQGDDWTGVWAYDVAEPLGKVMVYEFHDGTEHAPEALARTLIEQVRMEEAR